MNKDDELFQRRLEREKKARQQAEQLLEQKSRDLYQVNQKLSKANEELKRQQAIVVHQEKMASLGQLSAGMAHEINNPIGYILNNLNVLQEYITSFEGLFTQLEQKLETPTQPLNDLKNYIVEHQIKDDLDDAKQLIQESVQGSQQVRDIIKNLKGFIHTNEEMDLKNACLNEGIQSTIKMVNNAVKDKLDIKTDLGDLPLIPCLAGQLNQVFMNLITNASDAMPEKGELHITSKCTDSNISLTFSDNGPGIPDEVIGKIFDPFFTTKDVGAGSGLGLSISYKIIEEHGGSIIVANNHQGGAQLTIQIPFKAGESNVQT